MKDRRNRKYDIMPFKYSGYLRASALKVPRGKESYTYPTPVVRCLHLASQNMKRLIIACVLLLFSGLIVVYSQPVDNIIGVKRAKVQQMLRPYRILDYQRDKVAYYIDKGIRQTVFYANDTCTSFLWAVNTEQLPAFITSLETSGYVRSSDGMLTKDGLVVDVRLLESGKATLLSVRREGAATTDAQQPLAEVSIPKTQTKEGGKSEKSSTQAQRKYKTDRYDHLPMNRGKALVIDMPLMQQEAQREKANPAKKVKDPQRNWVGEAEGSVKLLGWE